MTAISCGTIIRDSQGKILIGHMTNQKYWDFPKGKMEDGETELAAAIRETKEESNIDLVPSAMKLLSSNEPYRRGKRLTLFTYNVDSFDDYDIFCASKVEGTDFTEFDKFLMVDSSELEKYLSPAMYNYLVRNAIIDIL